MREFPGVPAPRPGAFIAPGVPGVDTGRFPMGVGVAVRLVGETAVEVPAVDRFTAGEGVA